MMPRGDFIDGRFVLGDATGEIDRRSPADLDDHVGTFPVAAPHLDAAVAAARRAQPAWERTPLTERAALLRRLGDELARRAETLVALLGREVGKPAWEARTEVAALGAKIQITLDEGMALVRGFSLDGGRLETRYRPHGVLAVLGPFNFPLHLPHGHIVPALATGNTVVCKPSDVAPASAQVYAEAFESAGFPPGVFNLVQGGGPEGAALASHADLDGVLFTGSYEVGVAIRKANLHRPGRLLALELGGKNAAIVLADAPLAKALHDVLYSGFVTAGQRCTAVSRVVVERPIAPEFLERLVAGARRLVVGRPTDPAVFMGPLSTEAGLAKFREAQEAAARESAETLLESGVPELSVRGYYATPAVHLVRMPDPASRYQTAEIFGPDLAVTIADDADHAAALADATPYGLAATVFTTSEARFESVAARLHAGCLGWNVPTVGSSSRLPFGGTRNSGNHRPAALFSTLYCTYPVALQRGATEVDRARLPPGFPA
jgi:succinylglutamic semialdehyde dehydrogenase